MNPPDEDELRARFEALRQEDRGRAPDFRGMVDRAQVARSLPRRSVVPLLWIAAAAGIVLAVAIAVREARQHSVRSHDELAGSFGGADTVSISRWRSPTASLLRMSGSEVLASSKILSSVLDGASRAAVQH
jgi:hypothetical protein